MSITQKLEATLSTSANSNIIVAIPEGSNTKVDPSLGKYLSNAVMPVAISDLVYGCEEKLQQPLYRQSFLDKCSALGPHVSFACI